MCVFVCKRNTPRERIYSQVIRECCLHNAPASRSFIRERSHEAEIIFCDPIIDQSVFTPYLFRLLIRIRVPSPSPLLVPLFGLKDADLSVFSTSSRPTAESAA